jgi:hypothetical protein
MRRPGGNATSADAGNTKTDMTKTDMAAQPIAAAVTSIVSRRSIKRPFGSVIWMT